MSANHSHDVVIAARALRRVCNGPAAGPHGSRRGADRPQRAAQRHSVDARDRPIRRRATVLLGAARTAAGHGCTRDPLASGFGTGGDLTHRTVKATAGVDLLIAPRRYVLDTLLRGRQPSSAGATVYAPATLGTLTR